LTQEAAIKPAAEIPLSAKDAKQAEKKKQVNIPELVESLKSTADDIGQISELSSEEKILITQFFTALFKLMQPLAPSIPVNQLALPDELGNVAMANVDPTGHIVLQYDDGRVELRDLSEERNRDLMTAVVADILPKFKNLTAMQRRKLENRIKFISTVTKEIQKSSDALAAAISQEHQ
jgi:hypothetical protein